jgi:hypothetical protein
MGDNKPRTGERKNKGGSTPAGWKIATAGGVIVIVVLLLLWPGGLLGGNPCGECCATINGGVDEDFGIEIDGVLNKSYYVGNVEIECMAMSLAFYNLLIAHDFSTVEEAITYLNDTYNLNDTFSTYIAWSYLVFEDARAIFDDSQYDNISIDGESFSACVTAVVFIPYVSIEVFYENGTTYDYFDFAMLTEAELAEFTDIEDPMDLISNAPDHLLLKCGDVLSFSIIKVVADTGEDPYVDMNVNNENVHAPTGTGFPF